ncbi:hypothetical protein UFOVP1516_68 [uncultured Caudovirales phage]|uniref:Uncharacterized protein n=1 Tax=uncultured Caudovirales phage TaxID=2100421 RepID=A0A6J7X7Z4_9CAUD|nr:hypothetical protein UFOVP887_67 [uncultured Caudovirales phage]CAB5226943.1 hypothetical protein UFOVP1516_68 [uncultured Caudovirales phage]
MTETTIVIQDNSSIIVSEGASSSIITTISPTIISNADIPTTITSTQNISSVINSGIQGPPGVSGNESVLYFISDNTLSTQSVDSFSYTVYGAVKYIIYATSGTSRQVSELLIIHDNSVATLVEYANIATSGLLATFTVSISSSLVQLMTTPSNINTNFKIIRTLLPA